MVHKTTIRGRRGESTKINIWLLINCLEKTTRIFLRRKTKNEEHLCYTCCALLSGIGNVTYSYFTIDQKRIASKRSKSYECYPCTLQSNIVNFVKKSALLFLKQLGVNVNLQQITSASPQ